MGAFGMIRVYICSPFRAADDEGRKRNTPMPNSAKRACAPGSHFWKLATPL